ncbi:MAG: DUF4190 domain-containing protein [Pyrinomonadaceae bacterium]
MKRCPACDQTYTDDALSFCINDGTALVSDRPSSYNPQATIMSPPPSVTEMPPYGDAGPTDWSAPRYSPPADLNAPGAWIPPPAPGSWQQPMGAPPPGMHPGVMRPAQQQQGLAVASLICGVISITLGLICGGPVLGTAAIILGIIALLQIKNDPRRYGGKGLAIAGIITGGLWILFGVFFLLILIGGSLAN